MTGDVARGGTGLGDAGGDFEAFAREAGPRLLRFGHALAGSRVAAEDLVQETLIRVGLAWHRLTPDVDPTPYARRTLLHLFLNEKRRRWRERLVPVPPERGHDGGADASSGTAALADARALLDLLPPRQRAAVAMRYVLDLEDATIAAELGCSTSTVRSQIARALQTLRSSRRVPQGGPDA